MAETGSRRRGAELKSHVLQAADIGFGKTRCDGQCIVETKRTHWKPLLSVVGRGINKYLKQNPEISLRWGNSTAGVRMDAINAKNMKAYFDLLHQIYDGYGFEGLLECVYNKDETGVPLQPFLLRLPTGRGQDSQVPHLWEKSTLNHCSWVCKRSRAYVATIHYLRCKAIKLLMD